MIPWFIVQFAWWLAPRAGWTLSVEWTHARRGADRLTITGLCHPYRLPWHAAGRSVAAARAAGGYHP